jgi:hypothetical protein
MKEEVTKDTIAAAEKEIAKAELWTELYDHLIEKEDEDKIKTDYKIKQEGLAKVMEFNQEVVNFLKKK